MASLRSYLVLLSLLSLLNVMLSFLHQFPARLGSRLHATRMISVSQGGHSKQDEAFMKLALRHAQHAFRESEVPVGAVVVDENGVVLAASRNRVEAQHDATAHAEIVAMRQAAELRKDWRLLKCTVYSTLEPCPMCLSAMQSFRVDRLVFGAKDTRLGACGTHINLLEAQHPFSSIDVSGGLLAEESASLLKRFFLNRRQEDKLSDIGRGATVEECDVSISEEKP